MLVLGVIAEFNPFHNGHQFLLQKSKELTGADFSIAIMGGNFLQRGEPACWNKWVRTEMALRSGFDLVIELPFVFSSQDARGFAQAGVKILDSLGVVDYITFGCENENIEIFSILATLIRKDPPFIRKIIKEELKKGDSFPKIREKAIISFYREYNHELTGIPLNKIRNVLRQPNNILALEYMISLQKLKSNIKVLPVKRIGSRFSEYKLEGRYSSATAIRNIINQYYYNSCNPQLLKELKKTMPLSTYQIISEQLKDGINPVLFSNFEQSIFNRLRSVPMQDLKRINGIQEGLENILKKAALLTGNIEELISMTKSKRYTRTRIQRIIIHSLLNLTKQEVKTFNNNGPLYCRVLGMTKKGRDILKKAKLNSKLPMVQQLKRFYRHNNNLGKDIVLNMLNYDILATDLYVLAYNRRDLRTGRQDFTRSINILNL
jgi:predicted nucleotidyltransferase